MARLIGWHEIRHITSQKSLEVLGLHDEGRCMRARAGQRRRLPIEVGLDHRTEQMERAALAIPRLFGVGWSRPEGADDRVANNAGDVAGSLHVVELEIIDREHEARTTAGFELRRHPR